jgi:hypothetical protein
MDRRLRGLNLFPKKSGGRVGSVRVALLLKDPIAAAARNVPSARAASVGRAVRADAVGVRSQIGKRTRGGIVRCAAKKGAAVASGPRLQRATRPGNVPAGKRARSKVKNGRALDSARAKAETGRSGKIAVLSAAARMPKGAARIGVLTENGE